MKYKLDIFNQETKEVVSSVELELEAEPNNILLKQGYGYRLVNLEENKFKLDDVSTKELVEELKKRKTEVRIESAHETEVVTIGDRVDERQRFVKESDIIIII